jgi:hypothetical protein
MIAARPAQATRLEQPGDRVKVAKVAKMAKLITFLHGPHGGQPDLEAWTDRDSSPPAGYR